MKTATYLCERLIGSESISIFRDDTSGGIFGIDASYLEQNFEDDQDIIVNNPINKGKILLTGM